MMIQPAPIRPGETIGIMCPAGFMPKDRTDACVQQLQHWGYKTRLGKTLFSESTNYFSGTDAQRAADLQQMLDDDDVRTILFGRGGYGMSRIIDRLDFTRFLKNPKWIAGYSDITVLLAHLYTRYGISTLHAPMAGAFQDYGPDSIYTSSIRNLISGGVMDYKVNAYPNNREGEAVGRLMGGNLALFTHLIGSSSFPDTSGSILFLEDVGEQLYNIDRMLRQLKRGGYLERLSGLIFGGFTDCKDTERPFGQSLEEILLDVVKEYDYPVCFDFPAGHIDRNLALVFGKTYSLSVTKNHIHLKYI